MFLVALTRAPLNSAGPSVWTPVTTIRGFHLTMVTGSWMARAIRDGHRWELIESVAPELGHVAGLTLVRVSLEAAGATLEISRSHMGGRPVYYHFNSSGELFCSSHVFLLSQAGVLLRENKRSLPEFFIYQYVLPPNTLFEGVAQIPGGATIRIGLIDDRWHLTDLTYHNLSPARLGGRLQDADDVAHRARELLAQAIAKLTPRRDALAALLSGGLDSSVLWTLLHRVHGVPRSYSAGFPFEAPDTNVEKEYALSAAAAFGSVHCYFEPTPADYVRGVVESIGAAEVPVQHLQSVLLYLLFRDGLSSHERLVLTGEGADALFGLDSLMELFRRERRLFRLRESPIASRILSTRPVLRALRSLLALIGKGWALESTFGSDSPRNVALHNPAHLLWAARRFGNEEWVCRHFGVKPENVIAERYAVLRRFADRSLYDLWAIYVTGEVAATLSIFSKLAERSGKVVYAPFLVPELMELAWLAPWPVKLEAPKNIVRRMARQLGIPESIVTRPKSSFGVSPERWAHRHGIFEAFVPLVQTVFGAAEVGAMLVPDHDRAFTFWSMLNYAIWRSVVIEGETVEHLLDRVGIPPGRGISRPAADL